MEAYNSKKNKWTLDKTNLEQKSE